MEYLGYIAALCMGLSLGLLGGGGSILTVPILVYFFNLDGVNAATASLFIVGSTSLAGSLVNIIKKNIDYKTVVLFALPSFVGVFLVRRLILPSIPDTITLFNSSITKSSLMLLFFSLLMLFSAKAMIMQKKSYEPQKKPNPKNIFTKGIFVGGVTGFVGAGGGFLIVPALTILLNIPILKAIATSLAIITLNSLFGFLLSDKSSIPWHLLLMITSIGIVGLFLGQKLSTYIPERHLKKVFGYFILVIAASLIWNQL